jgi:hypothetical protein
MYLSKLNIFETLTFQSGDKETYTHIYVYIYIIYLCRFLSPCLPPVQVWNGVFQRSNQCMAAMSLHKKQVRVEAYFGSLASRHTQRPLPNTRTVLYSPCI